MKKVIHRMASAMVGVTLLAFVTAVVTDFPDLNIAVSLAICLAYFAYGIFALCQAKKKGDLIVVKGLCVSCERLKGISQVGRVSYRFVSDADQGGSTASIYIKGRKGMFLEGENYELLFAGKNQTSCSYTENNLIGYEVCKSHPMVKRVQEQLSGVDGGSVSDWMREDSSTQCETAKPLNNLIEFPGGKWR